MTTRMVFTIFLLFGNSKASEKDNRNDRSDQTEPTAGNCIHSKWEAVVSTFFDTNKDGKVSLTDMKLTRKTFTKLTKIKGQEKISREGMLTKWFTECALWNQSEIAEKDYGAIQKKAFLKDRDNFVDTVNTCEVQYLNLVNVDNNNYLSEKEETTLLRALGQTDEKKDKDFFKEFDPEDKGVLITNVLNDWVSYFTDDNCTKTANILDALKG